MVLADNLRASRKLYYSYNEGMNWTRINFWQHHIEVAAVFKRVGCDCVLISLCG